MRLQHTTLRKNWKGIKRFGLLKELSQGKMQAVWLHTADKTAWAFLHCVKRHGGRVEDVLTIDVDVPDEWVRRSSSDGLYYVCQNIPPCQFGGVREFKVVAASPLEVG